MTFDTSEGANEHAFSLARLEVLVHYSMFCHDAMSSCWPDLVGGDCIASGWDTDAGDRDLFQCHSIGDATWLVYFKPAARCGVSHPQFLDLPRICWASRLGDWHPRRTDMVSFRLPCVPGVVGR